MLDTDQLRSFLAIVDSGSFTKAAERVHKTQSAVSMHIRRLEEQLGCALFVKHGRGARLTDEGERLIEFARRIVQVEAGAMAALSRKGLRGAVRLGIPDDYAESFLAEILARFNRRHPLVEVSVVCEASIELAAQVAAGALDLALVTGPTREAQGASSCCARSRWSGSPPSDSGSRRERRSRSRSAAPTCFWRRATEEGADRRRRGVTADAVLLQEFQRDRHDRCAPGSRRRSCPSSMVGPGLARARADRGPARIALDPHGPHPRAGTSDRGSQGARRGDPRDHRRAGAPGRLSGRAVPVHPR